LSRRDLVGTDCEVGKPEAAFGVGGRGVNAMGRKLSGRDGGVLHDAACGIGNAATERSAIDCLLRMKCGEQNESRACRHAGMSKVFHEAPCAICCIVDTPSMPTNGPGSG